MNLCQFHIKSQKKNKNFFTDAMRFFHTHMKKSRFSFINKNDTLYSKKGNGSPFWEIKGEKIMKETKNRAGRDIIVVGFALFSCSSALGM